MMLILPPSANGRLVNRLADLLVAEGGNETGILVETQAAIIPIDLQELQKPAGLAFQTVHDLFIADLKDRDVQHRLPMVHHPRILPIKAAQMAQIEAEQISAGKIGHVARQAGIHWIPGAMDDACFGEEQGDETQVEEICGVFVGYSDRLRT